MRLQIAGSDNLLAGTDLPGEIEIRKRHNIVHRHQHDEQDAEEVRQQARCGMVCGHQDCGRLVMLSMFKKKLPWIVCTPNAGAAASIDEM